MTGLQSNVGLISGINYVELVDQLIELDGTTRTNLISRTNVLQEEKNALSQLMQYFSLSSYMIRRLSSDSAFKAVAVTSSNDSLIKATTNSSTGTAVAGSYTFTPIQVASAQQTVAKGVASDSEALGKTGTITLGKSWSVENEVQLSNINGGDGFSKGSIRITDGNGIRTTVDLRKAVTVNDVIDAINNNGNVDVVAELEDDHIVIRDLSGGDPTKVSVQEVSGGKTASSLGLLGKTADSGGTITGNSIYRLGENMSLDLLNDGNGIVFDGLYEDITIGCKDGSIVTIDFNRLTTTEEQEAGAGINKKELTVGDLLNTINTSTDANGVAGKIIARISDDGRGIVLEDTTTGGGFTSIDQGGALGVQSLNPILQTLGFVNGKFDGSSIDFLSGLSDTTKNAKMTVTDKAGHTTVIELTHREIESYRGSAHLDATNAAGHGYLFLADNVNAQLASAGVNVELQLNSTKTGYDVVDTSGGSGKVTFSNYEGCELASRLGLANITAGDAVSVLDGAAPGKVQFTDSAGSNTEIEITQAELDAITSFQDVADLFNSKLSGTGVGIDVQLNAAGDGLTITDTIGATPAQIIVSDVSSSGSDIAARLGIQDQNDTGVIEGTAFGGTMHGSAINNGTIQTRNLLGGLDSVLVSSLNGGNGIATAQAGGTVQVQDRSGKTAMLTFSTAELRSMQTLDNSIDLFNKKLSDAGVGITVQMNNSKTGLEVVDTTGKSSHNLIFKDGLKDTVIPEILAADAHSAGGNVTARSGNSGGLGGTCYLEFENTNAMNGMTFAFTNDNTQAGYNAGTKTFTFYLDETAIEAENDFSVRNQMVKDAIDEQIASRWSSINNSVPAPEVKYRDGMASYALADVASGKKTAIIEQNGGTLGMKEGTALLTFEKTGAMNGVRIGFTTDGTKSGYDSANQTLTVYLPPDVAAETDTAKQDQLIKEAIDSAIAARWTTIKEDSGASETDAVTVKLTEGLGAQALADAAVGAETIVGGYYLGGTHGQTYKPEETIPVASNIASLFGLNVDSANTMVGGSSLKRQIVSHSTALAELNGGQGVTIAGGKVSVTNSAGVTSTLTIDAKKHITVGDVINEINRNAQGVVARINDAGDGITLEDTSGGEGTFVVADADSTSKFASTLGIAGSTPQDAKDEDGRLRITSSETHEIEVTAEDTLDTIRQKINDLNKGYSASILVDGSSTPYRLSISSKTTGEAAGFNVDLSAIGLTTETMSEANDALIAYGDINQSSSLILHSKTNNFKGIVAGIDLTITGVSDSPVTITAAANGSDVKVALETFVTNYNTFREFLNKQINYTVGTDGTVMVSSEEGMGKLWNSSIAKDFDRKVSSMLLEYVEGIPGVSSLANLGITMRKNYDDVNEGIGANSSTGTLTFNAEAFQAAWDSNPEAVEEFFFSEKEITDDNGETTTIQSGWAVRFGELSDSLIGRGDILGKTQARLDSLTETIDRNTERAEYLQERLDWKRQRYLNQFYAMEQAMAKMSASMDSVSSLASTWSSNYSATGA